VARDPSTQPALALRAPVDPALPVDVLALVHVPDLAVRVRADLAVRAQALAELRLQARRRVRSAHHRIVHVAADSSIRRPRKAR